MHIEQYFVRKDPKSDSSEIIYRAIDFETRLKVECVKRLIQKHIPDNADKIYILGIFDGKTRFRISVDESVNGTPTLLPQFLYQVMNWEGNSSRWNPMG